MITDRPVAILINVPMKFFEEKMSMASFQRFYMMMNANDEWCFYHFISGIPKHDILNVFICYNGYVQFKARKGAYLRNEIVTTDQGTFGPRNWLVTCGPTEQAPAFQFRQRGFQGFRYLSQDLF